MFTEALGIQLRSKRSLRTAETLSVRFMRSLSVYYQSHNSVTVWEDLLLLLLYRLQTEICSLLLSLYI